jgi:hypothetical protein
MGEPRGIRDSRQRQSESAEGLLAEPPRGSGAWVAAAVGAFWGLVSYSILWEAVPAQVDRAFVESQGGTLALLPSRIAIWAIALAEFVAGHSFDLSKTFGWIAPFASAIGGGLTVAGYVTLRTIMRRIRTS